MGGLKIVILSFLSSFSSISLFFKKFLSEDLPEYLITAYYPPSIFKILISGLDGFGALSLLNFDGK